MMAFAEAQAVRNHPQVSAALLNAAAANQVTIETHAASLPTFYGSLTEAQIVAAQGEDYMASPDLDEKQKAAVRWAETVTIMTARDDNDAFAEMKRHFSEKQIVELTVFCGMWNYSNRLCEALHVDLERPDKRIEFQE